MNEKRFFNHCFFGLQMHTSNVEIRNVEGECHFFADDELYSIHTIMNGEELPSSISIRFPSGMCGNGGWDFSSEFK